MYPNDLCTKAFFFPEVSQTSLGAAVRTALALSRRKFLDEAGPSCNHVLDWILHSFLFPKASYSFALSNPIIERSLVSLSPHTPPPQSFQKPSIYMHRVIYTSEKSLTPLKSRGPVILATEVFRSKLTFPCPSSYLVVSLQRFYMEELLMGRFMLSSPIVLKFINILGQ